MANIEIQQIRRLYESYAPQLLLFARSFKTNSPEDIVHDAFMKLIKMKSPPQNIQAWLFTVVRNDSISLLRKLQRHLKLHKIISQSEPVWFSPSTDNKIESEEIVKSLKTLPDNQREIVIMKIWGQMTFKEIAEITQKPISTIHVQYKNALDILKTALEDYHVYQQSS